MRAFVCLRRQFHGLIHRRNRPVTVLTTFSMAETTLVFFFFFFKFLNLFFVTKICWKVPHENIHFETSIYFFILMCASKSWDPGPERFRDLDGQDQFRDLDGQTDRFFFFFFFSRPKLPSSTDRVFFLPLLPTYLLGGMGLEWRKKKKAGTGELCPTVTGTH